MFNRNHRMFISTFISILFLTGLVFADPTDGCELNTNQLFLTSDGDVLYNSGLIKREIRSTGKIVYIGKRDKGKSLIDRFRRRFIYRGES